MTTSLSQPAVRNTRSQLLIVFFWAPAAHIVQSYALPLWWEQSSTVPLTLAQVSVSQVLPRGISASVYSLARFYMSQPSGLSERAETSTPPKSSWTCFIYFLPWSKFCSMQIPVWGREDRRGGKELFHNNVAVLSILIGWTQKQTIPQMSIDYSITNVCAMESSSSITSGSDRIQDVERMRRRPRNQNTFLNNS